LLFPTQVGPNKVWFRQVWLYAYALRLFLPISALYTNVISKCYEFQWSIQTYFNTTSEW
jgi:hypothetical protein